MCFHYHWQLYIFAKEYLYSYPEKVIIFNKSPLHSLNATQSTSQGKIKIIIYLLYELLFSGYTSAVLPDEIAIKRRSAWDNHLRKAQHRKKI